MKEYFNNVSKAGKNVFKTNNKKDNIKITDIEYGTLSNLDIKEFKRYFESDLYIVFGISYIKQQVIDLLIEKRCINLHMGVSPYYRGAACNYWALKDCNYDKIGGTIHYISKGLDSGNILNTFVINSGKYDMFEVGMLAVKGTIYKLINLIKNEELLNIKEYK